MKKLALALALSGIILSGPALADHFHSHGMTIYGRLETAKSGCTVLMSKYVLNLKHSDENLKVQGTVIDTSSADDHIYVQLGGESCDADENYQKIGLKFIGTPDNSMGNTLANTASGSNAAKGVGVQLSDMESKIITPNNTIGRFMTDGAHTASFPLYFTMVSLKDQKANAGSVQTNMTIQIERL